MNSDRPRQIAAFLLPAMAFAWPLDVYTHLPLLHAPAAVVLGAVLVAAWGADVVARRRVRLSFELAWPLVLALAAYWAHALMKGGAQPLAMTGCALLFAATAHFAVNRQVIGRCLTVSALACGLVAVMSVASWAGFFVPTAFGPEGMIVFAGPVAPTAGLVTLLVGFAFAEYPAGNMVYPHWARQIAWGARGVMAFALVGTAILGLTQYAFWRPPDWFGEGWAMLLAVAAAGWLAARVAAKLVVDRRDAFTRTHGILLLALGAGAAAMIAFGEPIRHYHAFLLALAAGYALPYRAAAASAPGPAVLLVLVAVLVWSNLEDVSLADRRDPRNYAAYAEAEFEAGNADKVEARMDVMDGVAPHEARTHYWRARAALEREAPLAAALFFEAALVPPREEQLLPPLTQSERQRFLGDLRDYCSGASEEQRRYAYERALVADGQRDEALAALEARLGEPEGAENGLAADVLTKAMAHVLGDVALADAFSPYSAAQLHGLWRQWGGETQAGIESRDIRWVLIAERQPAFIRIHAVTPHTSETYELAVDRPHGAGAAQAEMAWETHPNAREYEMQELRLRDPEGEVIALGHVIFNNSRVIGMSWDAFPSAPPRFTPLIRMGRLPSRGN
ncbi:MAG: hypothetical protein ACLFU6_00955 [Candidatus Hydrogenedentota bacterium]